MVEGTAEELATNPEDSIADVLGVAEDEIALDEISDETMTEIEDSMDDEGVCDGAKDDDETTTLEETSDDVAIKLDDMIVEKSIFDDDEVDLKDSIELDNATYDIVLAADEMGATIVAEVGIMEVEAGKEELSEAENATEDDTRVIDDRMDEDAALHFPYLSWHLAPQ